MSPEGIQARGLGSSPSDTILLEAIASPVLDEWDNREFTYVASGNGVGNIETIVYKFGSTTVATRTFTYDSNHNLITDTTV